MQQINDDDNFGLQDYENEDFPESSTKLKALFDVKNLQDPVLWIRVDPEVEFIRKTKIYQKKDNWLYQLLLDKDNMSKIEACKELAAYQDEDVSTILKSFVKAEQYFFKVRKHALRTLEKT